MNDYQTHVFTCTYTADVSGVCSAMYELGGMTVLHDPSGCNSTYSTHDEPRWFDSDSLMFVSGLDEMTAVLGDDSVLIEDIAHAAADLHPRFITLCGASIPHIIAFDYKGVARLIERRTGIPTIPVATDGMKSYVSGVGKALTAWIKRFADPAESPWTGKKSSPACGIPGSAHLHRNREQIPDNARDLLSHNSLRGVPGGEWDRRILHQSTDPAPGGDLPPLTVNLLGVTPLDFSVNGNAEALCKVFEDAGIPVNCCAAMGETFDSMRHIYRGAVNVVASSAGRRTARYMERAAGTPRVEGLPIGAAQADALVEGVRRAHRTRENISTWEINPPHDRWALPEGQILVIGEEIFAQSLAAAINRLEPYLRNHRSAYAIAPDVNEGFPEEALIAALRAASVVIADPLYRAIPLQGASVKWIDFPHEAYSGRIYRGDIPVFASGEFDVAKLLFRIYH